MSLKINPVPPMPSYARTDLAARPRGFCHRAGPASVPHRRRRFAPLLSALGALAALVQPGAARAEAPRFTAEVDRAQVIPGEPFVYEVTLSVGNDQVSDYRPPDFKGLRVLSRPNAPNQSTQMQFGGAGMFVQLSYSWRYELAAAQKGNVTIGPARARVNGQDLRSNPVTVSAAGAAAAPVPPPLPDHPPPSAAPGSGSGDVPGGSATEAAVGGSFIRLVTDKQRVFVGEAIAAAWYLYMNEPADKYDTQVEPRTEGFWTEDIVVPSRRGGLMLTQETVQGRAYQVGMVLKKALFPLRPGRLTISPMEAEISRSDFFGNAVRSQRLRSTPTTIEVLPLPKAGQPANFDTANVGTFTMDARVDRATVAVGEPVTLTIEISGQGNLRKVALPTMPKLPGWKTYEPRVNVVIDPATGISGTKTAEILLLPERPGPVTLPGLVLEAFDPTLPETRRYTRVSTRPISLTATGDATAAVGRATPGGGAAAAAGGGSAAGTFSENVIAEEIRPLHARSSLRRDLGTTFFRTSAFPVVLGLPPLGFALAVALFGIRARMADDTGPRRRRRARQKVRAHLAAADGHRQRGDVASFYIEIDRVLRAAIASRLGQTVQGLRMDELRAVLGARSLPAAEIERVIALLETCDAARFAPGRADADRVASLNAVLDSASDLIDVLEKAPLTPEAQA